MELFEWGHFFLYSSIRMNTVGHNNGTEICL